MTAGVPFFNRQMSVGQSAHLGHFSAALHTAMRHIEAVVLATEKGLSVYGDPDRGNGLHHVVEQAKLAGDHLVIHSRKVFLIKFQDGTLQSIKASEYSGTIIVPTVPL